MGLLTCSSPRWHFPPWKCEATTETDDRWISCFPTWKFRPVLFRLSSNTQEVFLVLLLANLLLHTSVNTHLLSQVQTDRQMLDECEGPVLWCVAHMCVKPQRSPPITHAGKWPAWTLSGCWVMSGFFASSGRTSARAIVSNVNNIQEREGENWNAEVGGGRFSDNAHINMLTVGQQESEERGWWWIPVT